jgi:hypothetical protein
VAHKGCVFGVGVVEQANQVGSQRDNVVVLDRLWP